MLVTCPATFFFQDITDATYELVPLVPVPVALVVPLALLVPVLGLLVLPGPVPPLLSSRAQAVSFPVLTGSLLM
jgi:hypothetical protein